MEFSLELLEKYLTEVEKEIPKETVAPESPPKDKEDKPVSSVTAGFELAPIIDEELKDEDNEELKIIGYNIKKGNKTICKMKIHNNADEELIDFNKAQNKTQQCTVYISDVNDDDRADCDMFKNKLVGLGFVNIVDKDEKYKVPVKAEEKKEQV